MTRPQAGLPRVQPPLLRYRLVAPLQVGFPKCVGDHAADNTTWFEVDGRSCMCDKGTLFCKKVRRAGAAASNRTLYYPCSSLFFALYPLTSDCPPHPPLCRPLPAATS